MRWKMRSAAAVVVTAVVALLLATAETVLAAGGGGVNTGGGGGGSIIGSGSGGGGGGGRQRGAATATSTRQPQQDDADESLRTPAAVQCASCSAHKEIKSLSIELIKISILNKLGMQQPPEFGGRMPPRVPTDLPPLQDLMRRYNNNDRGSSVVVLPHLRHQSHHYEASGDGVTDMQSDEASGYAAAAAAAIASMDNSNGYNGGASGGGGGYGDDDDDEDDFHIKTHKLIAFAQPHPMVQKVRNHNLLFFTFSDQMGQHRITEAILWVYKRRLDVVIDESVVTIDVFRINTNSNSYHQTMVASVKRVINTTEPGWVPIDLQRRKSDWFRSTDGAKNLTLMVHAYYITKNTTHGRTPFVTDARKRDDMTEIPYLEVLMRDGRRPRPKRNLLGLDCNENSDEPRCCRYPLTVDFEDFGWDWIIAPKRYDANYCSGECRMVFMQKYPHTHLTQLSNKTGMYPGTGPCCAPRKLSALAMLYFDQEFKIIYRLLPGMVVDRCGCS